jgi:GNAT superfamily N-acetyltransferase
MTHTDVTVRAVDEVPWSDAETVFGTRGDPSTCWCQFYKVTSAEWKQLDRPTCASRLYDQVKDVRDDPARPAPGLIAYEDGEPIGWVAVEPRTSYPTALRGKVITGGSSEAADDASVWAVVCFVVRVGFRRRGVAGALLAAAVSHARDHGARLIEGYPVDVVDRQKTSSADLYHGTVTLFEGAGFTINARPIAGRAVMTLRL